MPYLTFIGPHAGARYNVSRFASRGYWLFRRGSTVVTRWGPIKVDGRRGYTVRWACQWREKTYRYGSPASAKAQLQERLEDFLRAGHGYQRMEHGTKILAPRQKD